MWTLDNLPPLAYRVPITPPTHPHGQTHIHQIWTSVLSLMLLTWVHRRPVGNPQAGHTHSWASIIDFHECVFMMDVHHCRVLTQENDSESFSERESQQDLERGSGFRQSIYLPLTELGRGRGGAWGSVWQYEKSEGRLVPMGAHASVSCSVCPCTRRLSCTYKTCKYATWCVCVWVCVCVHAQCVWVTVMRLGQILHYWRPLPLRLEVISLESG